MSYNKLEETMLDDFKKVEKSKNPLRWIVDNIFHPISVFFFMLGLRMLDKYRDEEVPPLKYRIANFYYKIYKILDYPYSRWGTVWILEKREK